MATGLAATASTALPRIAKELLPLIERPALFSVDMSVVIADRGASADVPGKRSIRCPTCGGRETEIHVTAPSKGGPRR
jgi:hypothetical protein